MGQVFKITQSRCVLVYVEDCGSYADDLIAALNFSNTDECMDAIEGYDFGDLDVDATEEFGEDDCRFFINADGTIEDAYEW